MGTPSVPAAQVSSTPTHNQPTSSSSTVGASKPPQNKPAFSGSTVGGKKSVHQPIGSLVPGTLNVSTSSNANAVASSSWFAPGSQPLASSSSNAAGGKSSSSPAAGRQLRPRNNTSPKPKKRQRTLLPQGPRTWNMAQQPWEHCPQAGPDIHPVTGEFLRTRVSHRHGPAAI